MPTTKLTPEEKELWLKGDNRWQQLFNARQAQGATDNAIYVHPTESNLEEVVIRPQAPTIAESIFRTVKKDWNSRDIHGKIDLLTSTLGPIPGIGDVADFVDAGNQFAQGNWGTGSFYLLASAIPGVSGKQLKTIHNSISNIYNGIKNTYKHARNFKGANKLTRGVKAVSKVITSPSYAKTIGENPWLLDHLQVYDIPEYNTQQVKDFVKLILPERSKGAFNIESSYIQSLKPGSSSEQIKKSFMLGRKGYDDVNLAKRYARFLNYRFDKMYNELYSDPIYKSILDESPQYIDLVYKSFKRGENKEVMLKRLINQSNSYRRFMNKPELTPLDYKTFKGKSSHQKGLYSIDVEGIKRSDFDGEYGAYPAFFQGKPDISGPIETWWSQRIPKGITVKKGMHSTDEQLQKLIKKLNINDGGYNPFPFIQEFNASVNKKFTNRPVHQVFIGNYGEQLPNFEVTVGKMPEDFVWGRGYKQGGKLIKKK